MPVLTLSSHTLRDARERAGLSREQAAVDVGIAASTLQSWEAEPPRSVVVLAALAELYGMSSIDALFAHEENGTALGDCRGKNTGPRTAAVEGSAGPDSHTGV